MNEQSKDMTEEEKTAFDAKKKASAKAYADRKESARKIILEYLGSPELGTLLDRVVWG